MKIKYSALVSDARGKLNGSVASRNRYGSYLRNKMTPVNRRTAYQQANRAIFGAMSAHWNSISEAERQAWRSYAQDNPYTDIFGDQKTLQGNSMFTGVNTLLVNSELPALDAPILTSVDMPHILISIDSLTATAFDIEISSSTTDADKLVLYATAPVSAGKQFLKNDYRIVAALDVADFVAEKYDFLADYTARFGAPVEGSRIGLGLVQVADSGKHTVMEAISQVVLT